MRATAKAQPNIALIKYWGKRDSKFNLPATGSISLTLADLFTEMHIEVDETASADRLRVNGGEDLQLLPRVSQCLDFVGGADRPCVCIESTCNFPIGAGLASSASAFAALVVAADAAFGTSHSLDELVRLAGRASGSAARSLKSGIVELRNEGEQIAVECLLEATEWPLNVVIAITTPAAKAVSSGAAMEVSRKSSPFYARWLELQSADLAIARDAIARRDFGGLGKVAEHNCLKMHSVMWSSRPPLVYWNSATLNCMQAVRMLQAEGVPVFFTIDAGPQLKAVCEPGAVERVRSVLTATAGVIEVMTTSLGAGARIVAGR